VVPVAEAAETRVACPACGTNLQLPPGPLAKTVKCPGCRSRLRTADAFAPARPTMQGAAPGAPTAAAPRPRTADVTQEGSLPPRRLGGLLLAGGTSAVLLGTLLLSCLWLGGRGPKKEPPLARGDAPVAKKNAGTPGEEGRPDRKRPVAREEEEPVREPPQPPPEPRKTTDPVGEIRRLVFPDEERSDAIEPEAPSKLYPLDLRIVAVIDGSDELRITSTETRWTHVSWDHPTQVRMNGMEWNPKDAPVRYDVGIPQLLGKQVEDLSKVRMKKIRGRGRVELRSGKDFVTVVFDDPDPGADTYEVILTFGE
jgi:hypothetical protein